jgi:predicted HAD superfamily Cof-like phosphohydrolase
MSEDWYQDIVDFEEQVRKKTYSKIPHIPSVEDKELRKALITEEIKETLNAIEYDDLVELADGLADAVVVLLGTAITYGIDLRPVWSEVHRSNMTKKGGAVREDGKLLKPKWFSPPDIKKELELQGWIES